MRPTVGWITVLPCALGATVVVAVRKNLLPSMREYLTSLWRPGTLSLWPFLSVGSSFGKDVQSAPGSMAMLHTL